MKAIFFDSVVCTLSEGSGQRDIANEPESAEEYLGIFPSVFCSMLKIDVFATINPSTPLQAHPAGGSVAKDT